MHRDAVHPVAAGPEDIADLVYGVEDGPDILAGPVTGAAVVEDGNSQAAAPARGAAASSRPVSRFQAIRATV
jgi:hypothetical protein